MKPIGNFEYLWNDLITNRHFPTDLYRIIPGSQQLNIDARQAGQVVLTQQSLADVQERKKDMIAIAEPVMKEFAGLIQTDSFIALCDQNGTAILATNVLAGIVCPGAVADGETIRRSIENRCLTELTIYCNDGNCVGGYFSSVIFPIHDNEGAIQGILSMGSYNREISEELRLAVFLGASLIETRFQYWQTLKGYSDSFIGALPELALLINENGYIESVSDFLVQRIGTGNTNFILGQPFEQILRIRDKSMRNRMNLRENIPVTLKVADQTILCTVINNRLILGPFGTTQQLLLIKESHQLNKIQNVFQKCLMSQNGFDRLIGMTTEMKAIKDLGQKAAKSGFTVLINGESGTGKELLAEAIHQESGRSGPFIPINCGAIPRELLQSELFGFVEGSFTGGQKGGRKGKLASAHGGTVFLDEIGEMPLEMQVALLRFLQDRVVTRIGEDYGKKVDVRIIAATHRNLLKEIEFNRFRLDLYYRLREISITMPPLRNRKEDIPLLVTNMLNSICEEHEIPRPKIEERAILYLSRYDWPGNCRELQNVLKTALVYMSNELITLETLKTFFSPDVLPETGGESLQDIEKRAIVNRLTLYEGNISQTASSLNINRSTLYRKLKDFKLQF